MKAIIIGGAGFIGSNIAKLLSERNYEVIVFDNLSSGNRANIDKIKGIKLIEGDIRDKSKLENTMKGCQKVFHLAASIGNLKSINHPQFDSEVNVIGTLNVLDSARKNKIERIIYSSSAAIFGEPSYQPIDEQHPFAPDSPYGVSKLAGELHCLCYNYLYNMKNVCLRYFNVYGINQRYDEYGNVIPIFATILLQNKPITIYGDGEQTRDFVNVKDIALANVLAAENIEVSGVFNIGSGKAITINTLGKLMKEITSCRAPINYAPARKGEVLHSMAIVTKAKKTFLFEPKSDLKQGLKEYINWFKNELSSR